MEQAKLEERLKIAQEMHDVLAHRISLLAMLAELAVLTEREREVAIEVARGGSNAEIAASLSVSVATVKANITRIFAKLGTDSRVHVAMKVPDAGLSDVRAARHDAKAGPSIDDRGDLGLDENAGLEEDVDPDQRERRGDVEFEGRLFDSRVEGVVHLPLPAGGVPREADDVVERRSCRAERLGDAACYPSQPRRGSGREGGRPLPRPVVSCGY
ncbi:response regulator transcription factor [Nonomuraea jabiensis]|uniref:response regulator transcription factor n=1 Tax=Nonomuraea jabiensis TaxID=882448 RepID=UPI0036CDB995